MSTTDIANIIGTLPEADHCVSVDNMVDNTYEPSFAADIGRFESCLEQVGQTSGPSDSMQVAKAALEPFNNLNARAAELAEFATNATEDGQSFTPSEVVTLTYKAQEFGFHSQLTANIANRLADGIQQLFRQQG